MTFGSFLYVACNILELVKTAKCHACGKICQILFGNWSLLSLFSKKSIVVSYNTERKKKETISECIENRLYIKII